jgi:hypothetical protein
VIARAIAAFTHNNKCRTDLGLPELDHYTFPAIIMYGTTPTFYKIPVTEELRAAVARGVDIHHSKMTTLEKFVPDLPEPAQYDLGLQPLANRRYLLSCFEALKGFLVSQTCRRFPLFANIVAGPRGVCVCMKICIWLTHCIYYSALCTSLIDYVLGSVLNTTSEPVK